MIQASTLQFLKDLKKNNDRDWFNANKARFVEAQDNVAAFTEGLMQQMSGMDQIEMKPGKKAMMRIYRDVRFSKDKSPYKTRFVGFMKRATEERRGTYAFNLEPDNYFVGGGFWGPEPKDLLKIRKGIQENYDEFLEIVNAPLFVSTFEKVKGEGVKTAPKGFAKDDPAIEHLRLKQFLIGRNFTEKEVLDPKFGAMCVEIYHHMRPFLDFMTNVLIQKK